MNNIKLISIYRECEQIFQKILDLTETEKDNKKWLDAMMDLLKQVDRIYANTYENPDYKGEKIFIEYWHRQTTNLLQLLIKTKEKL